jgi:hypothetical protein
MYALFTQVLAMMIFRPSTGRKRLTVRERIAICLGFADDLTFADETCKGAAGDRELAIDQLKMARDALRPDAWLIWKAYEEAVAWSWRGKGLAGKAVRLALITPEGVLLRDDELAKLCSKHCGRITRQRINVLRHQLWAVLVLVKDEVVV